MNDLVPLRAALAPFALLIGVTVGTFFARAVTGDAELLTKTGQPKHLTEKR